MGVNGEALQLHAVYKRQYFFTASHARIRISTTSHVKSMVLQVMCAASEHAMKSKVCMINHYHHSTKLYRKKYHSFVAVGIGLYRF